MVAIEPELDEASYRGAVFFIRSANIEGGRKDSKKEFIDSDLQVIEDLGLKQRVFTLSGTVAARRDNAGKIIKTYIEARDELLAALEKGKTGVLIHPWYGKLYNIACRTYNLDEDVTRLGDAGISIVFEVSNTDGIPVVNKKVIGRVSRFHELLLSTGKSALGKSWSVTKTSTGNFQAAKKKLDSFITTVNDATSPIKKLSNRVNEHTTLLSNFSGDVVSLVSAPSDLSDSITGAMSSVFSLYATSNGTLTAFKNLFDFGDNDINLLQITAIAIERKKNNDALNSIVQSEALGFAYLSASQIDYETVAGINEVESDLDIQYKKLALNPTIDAGTLDALTDLRVATQEFFEQKKLSSSGIITVQTNPTSTRLLAYNYYGKSDRGEAIAELNELYDLSYHQGDIRIFTA